MNRVIRNVSSLLWFLNFGTIADWLHNVVMDRDMMILCFLIVFLTRDKLQIGEKVLL